MVSFCQRKTQFGMHVDFVVYGPGVFMAVEVKNTASVQCRDLRGLRTFGEDSPKPVCCCCTAEPKRCASTTFLDGVSPEVTVVRRYAVKRRRCG